MSLLSFRPAFSAAFTPPAPHHRAVTFGAQEPADRQAENRPQDGAVKVCGTWDEPSALAILNAARHAGHDNLTIGLLVGITHESKEKMTPEQAGNLAKYIRKTAYSLSQPVKLACVTHLKKADDLITLIREIEERALFTAGGLQMTAALARRNFNYDDIGTLDRLPLFDVIQIHDDMPLSEIKKVKRAFPTATLLKAVHVPQKGEAYNLDIVIGNALALARESCIDGLLLDSSNLSTNQIGGTGLVNNWSVAKQIIDRVHQETGKPVALAGGLNPDNVSDALAATGADMVDANSGYRIDRQPGAWRSLDTERSAPKDAFAIEQILSATKGKAGRL